MKLVGYVAFLGKKERGSYALHLGLFMCQDVLQMIILHPSGFFVFSRVDRNSLCFAKVHRLRVLLMKSDRGKIEPSRW